MIQSLHIENYALIAQLDIDFHPGFSVITGETGAGKSIILGAIELLRGGRADMRSIKQGERRCVVEAVFDVSDYGLESFFANNELDFEGQECIIRRELTAAGKSRAFINDTPVQLRLLGEIGGRLLDVHSQHQNLLLSREDFQQNVLDIFAENANLLAMHQTAYRELRSLRQQLQAAIDAANRNKDEEDYLRFQYQQIEEAHLHEGEQTELEAEQQLLEHAEDIKQELQQASLLIDDGSSDGDVLQRLKGAMAALHRLDGKLAAASELSERIDSCYIELKDIADELESKSDDVEYNPQRLEQVNDRLNQLYSLAQKHRVDTVEELLALGERLAEQLTAIDHSDEHIESLRQTCEVQETKVKQLAEQLTERRTHAAKDVERRMQESLQPLGMPNVQFAIKVCSGEAYQSENGCDKVQFLFSANRNGALQDLAYMASGGEIARVMLALKSLIASAVKMPTVIFDEIDTGVSGSIAEKMAHLMQDMAGIGRQVISITHLPQIAALGRVHYKVYKEDHDDATTSHIRQLSNEERVEELAHMLSGETLTAAALENARELLKV